MTFFPSIFQKKSQKFQPGQVKFFSLIGSDPFVDWTLIVVTTCFIGAVLIAVGGYLYVSTEAQLATQGTILPASNVAAHFDAQKLKDIIATFDAHAKERVMLGKGYVAPKDPSLP